MKAGISTACLYPMETEQALKVLAEMGTRQIEIFVNAPSELSALFMDTMARMKDAYGCEIVSLHPFLSGYEPFLFFTEYERRFHDGVEMYRPIFASAARLGAKYVVFHGNYRESRFENQRYFERYHRLFEVGKEYGVLLCQENVERCKSCSTAFIREMSEALGEDALFVLDVKQALRSGVDPIAMAKVMGKHLRHIHISDSAGEQDCLPIGWGNYDFAALREALKEIEYDGALILELYRQNFQKNRDLYDSCVKITKLFL
ncbi:sugar phosphate isomerase/epimerase family protein [Zongyangia hominis]|uniref:Sugar phosphate isomerase/epimerase n=1 Tax=Zongyangia hominis TaxID=2763677 RepID=A0A926ECB2_9FIRM|nr:sugar phosphate isomerase/epimerase [Zongyangia hominis]MBC8569511.1 sugar phosphate isomerase/epimerase [Zongyangia hominis]